MTFVREPAVAGQFYPEDPGELKALVDGLLGDADATEEEAPKALIAPHAGYIYSGAVAATAYARLSAFRDVYRRVVLLGPCHRVPVVGMAVSGAEAFRTPLGDVPVDRETVARLEDKGTRVFEPSHQYEHSLEVQLPFLQAVLGEFSIVPVVVGEARPQAVANLLEMVWSNPTELARRAWVNFEEIGESAYLFIGGTPGLILALAGVALSRGRAFRFFWLAIGLLNLR